tara:strand:- start:282 stop:494 length:213 start_codon:yes stop_codon:yes gene_type:complete
MIKLWYLMSFICFGELPDVCEYKVWSGYYTKETCEKRIDVTNEFINEVEVRNNYVITTRCIPVDALDSSI